MMLPYDYSRCTGSVTKNSGKVKECETRLYCLRYLAGLHNESDSDRPVSYFARAEADCDLMIPLETI